MNTHYNYVSTTMVQLTVLNAYINRSMEKQRMPVLIKWRIRCVGTLESHVKLYNATTPSSRDLRHNSYQDEVTLLVGVIK